jgi:hypothetical protein
MRLRIRPDMNLRTMPRGKPAFSGRGRGGRGRGRGGGAPPRKTVPKAHHVAKPAVRDLPANLSVNPSSEVVPSSVLAALPEFRHAQSFFSSLERLCPEFAGSVDGHNRCWLGVPGSSITNIVRDAESAFNATLIFGEADARPIFVKRIHLLDPVSAMEGEYVWPRDGALPAPSEPWRNALTKINDPMNEAYVDTLFAACASKLVESGRSPHWCRAYGTFSARADKYMFNITDEYGSMRHKPWWRRNQRLGLFKLYDPLTDSAVPVEATESKFAAEGGILDSDDFEDVSVPESEKMDESSLEEAEPVLDSRGPVQLSEPKIKLSRITSSSSSSSGTEADAELSDDDEEDDEDVVYAEFTDFPVQVTLLERAEGTLDELLDAEEDDPSLAETRDARWAAWLFQVIAALAAAQHWYGFVHNDLHTNNIMWVTTAEEYLYYRAHKGKSSWIARVPTYGRIMKIIDFGRATFTLPEPGGFFISDAFYPGHDAGEQYNCEPFYDAEEGARVEPNPSFDLCRLSVSLLESLYPERPDAVKPVRVLNREGAKIYTETTSGVYNMLWEWLQDDNGKNVLRSPDGEERYPDFDLYKAIAAEVHCAVPCLQFERPLFAGYKFNGDVGGASVYDLHIH